MEHRTNITINLIITQISFIIRYNNFTGQSSAMKCFLNGQLWHQSSEQCFLLVRTIFSWLEMVASSGRTISHIVIFFPHIVQP